MKHRKSNEKHIGILRTPVESVLEVSKLKAINTQSKWPATQAPARDCKPENWTSVLHEWVKRSFPSSLINFAVDPVTSRDNVLKDRSPPVTVHDVPVHLG